MLFSARQEYYKETGQSCKEMEKIKKEEDTDEMEFS